MKKKAIIWTGVGFALFFSFAFCVLYFSAAYHLNEAVRSVPAMQTPQPQMKNSWAGYPSAKVTLTIDLPPEISQVDLAVFGTMVDRQCYSPFDPDCVRNYSAQVVTGRMIAEFTVTPNAWVHFGYMINGDLYVENASINGVPMVGACWLHSWPVVSFMLVEATMGILQNPNCNQTFERYKLQLIEQGVSDGFSI